MKKIKKSTSRSHRIFAAVLAAALLFTMPGMASYAEAEDAQTEDISESVTVQAEDDAAGETAAETEAIQKPEAEESDTNQSEALEDDTEDTETDEKEPAEEETVPVQKEDVKECTCGTLCTQDSINRDCPVCGAEDVDLSRCKGEKAENNSEENKEDAGQKDTSAQDDIANLCAHHKEHTKDCGYSRVSEDGEGNLCTYDCRICPIEDLIAALPDEVTEDNAEKVRAQLNKILALYRELTAEEQEQIDLSHCWDLQAMLDEVNTPVTADGHAEQQADDEAKVDIGGNITYYSTLGEAFSAANGKNATITMLTNAECTSSDFNNPSPLVISGGIVTLDMNGKTLSGEGYGTGGIIGISGGSLAVQGNGTVEVRYSGMICTGGTLTVADTTFNLVGPGYGSAACAIQNGNLFTGGGTVIINGGTITGAASGDYGQIFHFAGTTIINDVTTTDGTRGVFHQNDGKSSGKLTINGGTFNNTIEVDPSDEGIQSVEALLGNGCAYKHQDGTWATDADLAGLTISNVTVEKIPLTINPQAETSWYYNSGAHSLKMNAVPVTEGGTITYEWYDGSTKLGGTADAYPVPETTTAGNYTYTCKATCDGYTLSHEFTFTVEACPHTGLEYKPQANNKHGGICPDCGTVVSEEHIWVDGVCLVCNSKAVAKVESNGVTTYYGKFADAWTAAKGGESIVTLLANVSVINSLSVSNGDNITFNGGTHSLGIESGFTIYGGELTITGGTVTVTQRGNGVSLAGGKLTVTGGTIEAKHSEGVGINVFDSGGTVRISGSAVIKGQKCGVECDSGTADIKISGGTITGSENAVILGLTWNRSVSELLENYGGTTGTHYAFYQNGIPVTSGLDSLTLPGGTYAVEECTKHIDQKYSHSEGSFTHTQTCAACGAVEEVNCCYNKLVTSNGQVPTIDCVCGATLTASLTGVDNLVYTGQAQRPTGVTFIVDGTTSRNITNISTSYSGNTDAGNGTATVSDNTSEVYEGFFHLFFPIAKATPVVTWNGGSTQTLTYTGQAAAVTADVQLVNNETGTVSYSYAEHGSDNYTPGLPTDAGTYSVKASFAEQKNYTAAEAELTLTISPLAVTVTPDSGQHKEYGANDPELIYTINPSLIGNDKLTGALTYTGEAVGTYLITQGTLAAPSGNYTLTVVSGVMFEITKPSLEKATVAVDGSFTYNGKAQTPTADQVKVTLNGTVIPSDQYMISASSNINAGKATVTITATESGNYSGSASGEFTIGKADVVKENLLYTEPTDLTYTGAPKKADVKANSLTGIGQITVKYKKDNNGDLLTEAVEPGAYHFYAVVLEGGNYKSAEIEIGSFTISYMDAPELRYNGNEQKGYYSGDVAITAVPADNHTYDVSNAIDGEYKDFFTISAQQGTVTKTLYFKDEAGHISDGVPVTVNFDLTPPTGEIAVGAKWWQSFLNFISFGHYAAKEYTVTIKAEDTGGSGIDKIAYVIVTGSSQYTDADALKAANLTWNNYDNSSKPTVPVNQSQYVVYARLTDKAGNVTYISTDGILLDSTPPTVAELTVPVDTIKDVTAGFTFTVSEAADYYYVVLPKDSAAASEEISAENIIVTCGGTLPEGTGTAINGVTTSGKGAVSGDTLPASVSVEAGKLSPYAEYTVYVTAVDRALDITSSGTGTPNGNIGNVAQTDFTTKKTLSVITNAPTVTGTYGQSVGDMTITDGTAKVGNTVLTGKWTVSDADKDKKPAVGTTEEVTVTFTPDNDSYDSVPEKVIPTVNPRSLNADGVTVSEVAGTYTYTGSELKPPVAVSAEKPASGISVSDSVADLTANDFTVSYSNNKNVGTASVTISGKGNYTGTVTRTFTIEKAPGRTIESLTGSYTDDGKTYTYTIKPTEGAVYRMGDSAWAAANVFKGITPGTSVTFSAKMPENENYKEGEAKSITVDFSKLTPAAPALSYQIDRTDVNNVKVTISPVEGAEYSFDGGTTWKSGEGANVQDGFSTSQTVTLSIRLKATDTHNQSPVQTVTVDLAKKDREAPPAFSLKIEANGETDYTVTIPPTEGCEYSFDGENWSESNVKTGAKVGETVTGYKRYKENNDYNTSNAVSDSKQMPKFTVKTPVITPAGGSYTGNVSVTITCGSPDAEIYYTTDGSTPTDSSTRYTGAFTVTAPATVKAIAIKEGLTDSAVVTASYTKQSSGGSGGGNSGNTGNTSDGNTSDGSGSGNENSGDSGQGSNGGNGSGNTTPVIPAIPSAAGTVPGTGIETVRPGAGNTAEPGTKTGTGSNSVQEAGTDIGIPFIKGEDGKIGWNVIRAEEEKAEEGSVINVDMNGTTVVPGDIFDSIKGRDITITFDMGSGIVWSVDGKSITRDASRDKADDIDFTVRMGGSTVPVEIVNSCFANNVTGERYSIQLSLAHDGEFGFIAVLSVGIGEKNAGYLASLYYYNEDTGELEFICADEVAQDGTVSFAFTHASDYVVVVDREVEEESGTEETTQPEGTDSALPQDRTDGNGGAVVGSPKEGQTRSRNVTGLIIAGIIALAGIGAGIVIAVKKKRGKKNNG